MPTRWRTRLAYTEPRLIELAQGRVALRFRVKPGGSVQYVGHNYIAVLWGGLFVAIPFTSLKRVTGTRRRSPHAMTQRTFHRLLQSWIDPALNPDAPHTLLWHSFVDGTGRRYHGVVRRVDSRRGVLLAVRGGRSGWLAWHRLAAVTELLE